MPTVVALIVQFAIGVGMELERRDVWIQVCGLQFYFSPLNVTL